MSARIIFMKMAFKCVLIDLSGTIHMDDAVVPGAVEAIKRLKSSNLKVRFATNTTKESQRLLHGRLVKLGFPIEKDEIFTSLIAARDVVVEMKLKPLLMLDRKALEDFAGPVDLNVAPCEANGVVIGLAPEKFNYDCMNQAFRLLLQKHPLIAIHKARYFKRKDGLALGPGPFVTALQHAADCDAIVVGKPERKFFMDAIKPFDCKPEECIMIGDDVRDDVVGAQLTGMTGMLVMTGKYNPGDEKKTNPLPNHVFKSVVEAIDFILKTQT